MTIREDDLTHPAVIALLEHHVAEARASTPRENAHALDVDAMRTPDMTVFTVWDGDDLLGVAALRRMDEGHGEVKSMRTAPAHLRRGAATALLGHIVTVARAEGMTRLSLETGTAPMFGPANRLYETFGFADGPVFGGYPESAHNRFMTLAL